LPHDKDLRAIGQSLESLGIVGFVLKKAGQNYFVHCDSLPDLLDIAKSASLSEKVWDHAPLGRSKVRLVNEDGVLEYDATYISWLDAQGQRKRRRRYSAQVTSKKRLSQLLRVIGRKLDQVEPHSFTVTWTPTGVSVEYELNDGRRMKEELDHAKLSALMIETRFRRAPRPK
jgi:hypothetical protein